MRRQPTALFFITVAGVIAAALWALWPGSSGGFLFDDFNNLSNIGAYGKIHDLRSLLLYVTSGEADPTGRPITLLSFLLDSTTWPASPAPFKKTNIYLHLLNGALLVWLLQRLGHHLKLPQRQSYGAAVLGGAFWILHPLFVSTTLYVIQREAMLPTSFVIIGLLLWSYGRSAFPERRCVGVLMLAASAWLCTALAVLSKGNGILLPPLLLLSEWTIFGRDALVLESRLFLQLRLLLLGIPSIVLFAWLITQFPSDWSNIPVGRSWTYEQRLLTEPRVLVTYLHLLWIPQASLSGLFNDGYRASTDLLHPWTTLPSVVLIALLLMLGTSVRRTRPALSFAILFYFVGHLLESTYLPLELYFEHRNYLPALPMFWPLSIWLTDAGSLGVVRKALAFILPIVLTILTHQRANLWGHPLEQAIIFAEASPNSPRAQVNAATYEIHNEHSQAAISRLTKAIEHFPDEPQISLNLIDAECKSGGASRIALAAAERSLKESKDQTELIHHWLVTAISTSSEEKCPGLDVNAVGKLIAAYKDNPFLSHAEGRQRDLCHLDGRFALAQKFGAQALDDFNQAITIDPTPDEALLQAALLGAAGWPELGLQHLMYYKMLNPSPMHAEGMHAIHLWLLDLFNYWPSEFQHLEQQLSRDTKEKADSQVHG